jgi:hypothetical protein
MRPHSRLMLCQVEALNPKLETLHVGQVATPDGLSDYDQILEQLLHNGHTGPLELARKESTVAI